MKKFIASILMVCMVLTTLSFTVFASEAPVDPDRKILLEVDTNELYAGDIVTVTVKLDSTDDVAHAEYVLTYNSNYFELTEGNSVATGAYKEEIKGTIEHYFWIAGGEYFASDETFATYKFKAIAQPTRVSDYFEITKGYATNYDESMDDIQVPVVTNEEEVTILLIDYTVKKYIDGTQIDETAGEETEDSFHYDDETHNFKVETVPGAQVSYEVEYTAPDGTVTTETIAYPDIVDDIKAQGTYKITYTVTHATGYAPVEETFTITVDKPDYVVEVGIEDYVDNKVLVLVYTNTPNVYFSYDKLDLEMVNVSDSDYMYDDPETATVEAEDYEYVYAYVADPTENDVLSEYEAKIKNWYNGDTDTSGELLKSVSVGTYDADINDNKQLTVDDITAGYGIANTYEPYFATDKYQYRILRLDNDNNKTIDGDDTGYVVSEVKKALGLN